MIVESAIVSIIWLVTETRATNLLSWLLPHIAILVHFLLFIIITTLLAISIPLLAVATIGQTTEQLSGFRRNTVDSAGINLDTAIQRTTGLLKIDTVSLLEQRHIMKVVDQRKVPRVGGIDLVVSRHLHPLLEVGQDGDALHWGDDGAAHDRSIIAVEDGKVLLAGDAATRGARAVGGRSVAIVVDYAARGGCGCGRGELELVDLGLVEGFASSRSFFLFLGVVV